VLGGEFPIAVSHKPFRPGELRNTWCNISKAQRALGYDPKTPISLGLSRTWEWFRDAMTVVKSA
jgi:UDP-glucose 4-epimerase